MTEKLIHRGRQIETESHKRDEGDKKDKRRMGEKGTG